MISNALNRNDLEDIVIGATVLGAGGGGPVYTGRIIGSQAIKDGKIRLLKLKELKDDANVVVSFGMGSPVVHKERWLDYDLVRALHALEKYLGTSMTAISAFEQGGCNTPLAMYTAANTGLPILDGDGVGRAVPELQMTTFDLNKISICPMAVADAKSRAAILEVESAREAEALARAIAVEYGGLAGVAAYPMTGRQAKRTIVPNTVSLACKIGHALRTAKEKGDDFYSVLSEVTKAKLLFRGSVSSVESRTVKGFDFGTTIILGEDEFEDKKLRIDFKNENMIAWMNRKPIVMVPDLISVVDDVSGEPLTNVDVKKGLKVFVAAIPAHKKVRTTKGYKMFKHVLQILGYEGEFLRFEEVN